MHFSSCQLSTEWFRLAPNMKTRSPLCPDIRQMWILNLQGLRTIILGESKVSKAINVYKGWKGSLYRPWILDESLIKLLLLKSYGLIHEISPFSIAEIISARSREYRKTLRATFKSLRSSTLSSLFSSTFSIPAS